MNFGQDRVLEPVGSLPTTAWKLDNSPQVGDNEVKISLHSIVFERENFYQLCSISQYDKNLIRERILKIVDQRGKLHNPYTNSSALFVGHIEEAGSNYDLGKLKVGDCVIGLSPLAGIPTKIDSIDSIDLSYSTIRCSGYVICAPNSKLTKIENPDSKSTVHLMRTIEEGGSIYGFGKQLYRRNAAHTAIIGVNLIETILYARAAKYSNGGDSQISFIIDPSYFRGITKKDLTYILGDLVDNIYLADVSQPIDTANKVLKGEKNQYFDAVIALENVDGYESIASLIVKDDGMICYPSINNKYSQGLLATDYLNKGVTHYGLDGFTPSVYSLATKLIATVEDALARLDQYYEKTKKTKHITSKRPSQISSNATQRIADFVYASPVTETMVDEILNVAQYDCNVIIQGETGVGKEKVFDLLLQNSPRKDKPCVKINCATISDNLAESEFFGYEKGSFTGANSEGKKGYFELATNGTLFLDEIGSLSLSMQAKLLRVLQENTFYRVGGTKPIHVNVRVVCANNIPLTELIETGQFREDLYYRLNICVIDVPPLRNRPDDIICLADKFLKDSNQRYGVEKVFTETAYSRLKDYHWPGNVRQLENTVHRLYISERQEVIDGYAVDFLVNKNIMGDSIVDVKKEMNYSESLDFQQLMDNHEKAIIAYALEKKGSTRKAAAFLGIPPATLSRKKLKYDL